MFPPLFKWGGNVFFGAEVIRFGAVRRPCGLKIKIMSKVSIDAIDRKILQYLIKNARMPFLEIARECGISGAAIHQRVRKLDEMGVILGSRLEIDPKKLGFDVCALIGIRVADPSHYRHTVEALKDIPEIVECHFTTGPYTVLVKLYARDNEQLMDLLNNQMQSIPGVVATETLISLEQSIKREVPVPQEVKG